MWRKKMTKVKPLEILAVAFYITIAMFSLYYGAKVISKEPQIMCGVAEISPDFSAADRMRCRQIRGHKL
jgi:hypothetical protein